MKNDKAERVYEQVKKIKEAEAELEKIFGEARRGRPPKGESNETGVETET